MFLPSQRWRSGALVTTLIAGCGGGGAIAPDGSAPLDLAIADSAPPDFAPAPDFARPVLDFASSDLAVDPKLGTFLEDSAASICGALYRCCDPASISDYFDRWLHDYMAVPAVQVLAPRLPPNVPLAAPDCPAAVALLLDAAPMGPWVREAMAHAVLFDATAAAACRAALDGAQCGPPVQAALEDRTCLSFLPPRGGDEQRRMFQRTLGAFAPCRALDDGASGAVYGTCDPARFFCCFVDPNNPVGCAAPAPLADGICQPVSPDGARCGAAPIQACRGGSDCVATFCTPESSSTLMAGDPCRSLEGAVLGRCQDGYCDAMTRSCAALLGDGAACQSPSQCVSGGCAGGACGPNTFCTGSGPGGISVSLTPAYAALARGGTQLFASTVIGAKNTAVAWSVLEPGGGAITPMGLYTAPKSGGRFHVVATSQADGKSHGSAAIDVAGSGPATVSTLKLAIPGPAGVAFDARSGSLWVVDSSQHCLRRLDPASMKLLDTVGTCGIAGAFDGPGNLAGFANPIGIAVDAAGALYVGDSGNHRVRKVVYLNGQARASTLAGNKEGFADGVGPGAKFDYPSGVAVDAGGVVYVADAMNCALREVSPLGVVTTVTGGACGDGRNLLGEPRGVAVDAKSGARYVSDRASHRIVLVDAKGAQSVFAGAGGLAGMGGFGDGPAAQARFQDPWLIALDGAVPGGRLLIADRGNHRIRAVTVIAPTAATVAGTGVPGESDGDPLAKATFADPLAVATDPLGTIFVSDPQNHAIRRVGR